MAGTDAKRDLYAECSARVQIMTGSGMHCTGIYICCVKWGRRSAGKTLFIRVQLPTLRMSVIYLAMNCGIPRAIVSG